MEIDFENVKMAKRVTHRTLVGYMPSKYPIGGRGGNCFGVLVDDKDLTVINFGYENLVYIMNQNEISWPIKVIEIDERYAVIHDERIPHEFYNSIFCEICTPYKMWPMTQKLERQRKIVCQEIIVHEKYEQMVPTNRPKVKI